MARKSTLGNVFSKTETIETQPIAPIKKSPASIYLTFDEKEQLAKIATQLGENRHAVLQFAVKEFLRRYAAGEYETKTETVTKRTLKSRS